MTRLDSLTLMTFLAITACATTGTMQEPAPSPLGIAPKLVAPAGERTQPWFPERRSAAELPSVGHLDRELAMIGDRFELGVRLCVAPDGMVSEVDLERSSGPAKLDRAAVADLRGWRYAPFAAPSDVRACKRMRLVYEPKVDRGHLGIPLVRVGAP